MTTPPRIGTPEYFESIYEHDDDPFGLDNRWYELRKRAMGLAALPKARYRRAFEPGCSNGAFTLGLAGRCDEVVAADASPRAVAVARSRLAAIDNVAVIAARVPDQWAPGRFDLIVVSELGYYLDRGRLETLVKRVSASLEPGGHLLVVHWRQPIEDCALNGDDVHRAFNCCPGIRSLGRYAEPQFLVEVFGAGPAAAVPGPDDPMAAPSSPAPGRQRT